MGKRKFVPANYLQSKQRMREAHYKLRGVMLIRRVPAAAKSSATSTPARN